MLPLLECCCYLYTSNISGAECVQVGDIPDVDVKPPDNVLFVCKLNPVTTSEDLEIIFSRFGPIARFVYATPLARQWLLKVFMSKLLKFTAQS